MVQPLEWTAWEGGVNIKKNMNVNAIVKQNCDMKILFCTNKGPRDYWVQVLKDQHLRYTRVLNRVY